MIYFDFEYRNPEVVDELVLVALQDTKAAKTPRLFDLRLIDGRKSFTGYFQDHKDEVWCCFNGLADLTCLLALGLDIHDLKFIDAMTEARMITLSHPEYLLYEQNLLATLRVFGVIDEDEYSVALAQKENTRDLIFNNHLYNDQQWSQICAYAYDDMVHLPTLMNRIAQLHNAIQDGTVIHHTLHRGSFTVAIASLHFKAKGYPVNIARLKAIYDNADNIKARLAIEVNNRYGDQEHPIYRFVPNVKGSETGRWVFSNAGFNWLIREKLHIQDWALTEAGQLNLQSDYLDEKWKSVPALSLFRTTRKTLQALGKDTLTSRFVDGHIRAEPFIFSQKTGRCSPKPTKGFILNLPPWLRSALIHPAPGEAFIGIDWSQQEIGIAAVLSGDRNLLEVYNSSDVYLTLAKMAGAVPPEATKQSHPLVRQNFKAVQLGIGYGKGVAALAVDIWENNRDPVSGAENITRTDALIKAREIYQWHKRYFRRYWDWIKQNAIEAKIQGYLASEDHWLLYCAPHTRSTQIQNFPMQANGAAMLRRAVYHVYQTRVLDLVCPLHDALYIRCRESEAEKHAQLFVVV
jgi:DNA polymerase-1